MKPETQRTYKRGNTWSYVVDLGPDPSTGKRRQKTKGGHKLKKEARGALNTVLGELQSGGFISTGPVTVRSYLVDHWLPARELRPTTIASYRDAIEGRIVPRIGGLRLDRLTPKHIEDLYADLRTSKARKGTQDKLISLRTVAYTGKVLSLALRDAVKQGLLPRNPAEHVPLPKTTRREMSAWTPAQARAFLEHVADDRLYALWAIYLTAALRRGEALGLRWSDIDLDRGRLSVRRTLVAVAYEVEWSEPKTSGSRRVVSIDRSIVAVLKAHRRAQLEERLAIGAAYRDDDLVFCRVDGTVLHPNDVTKMFGRLVKASGLPRIRLHDLRHTSATLLLEQGVPLKVVSERLGHSSVKITADVYAHSLETMQDDAAAKAGAALLGR